VSDPLRIGSPLLGPLERPEIAAPIERPGASFGDLFKKALNDTSGMQDNAQDMIAAYLRGEPVELHQVMAAGGWAPARKPRSRSSCWSSCATSSPKRIAP